MADTLLWALAASAGYLLGCVNGAILTSKIFYRDDVRRHGSGNAGLTNFYRTYGARYAWCVIAVDLAKAALAVGFGGWLGGLAGRYWMGLFVALGHLFPVFYRFQGGKGILCSGMTLLLIDWRVALVGWGVFVLLWAATRYVSLGSVCGAVSFPVMTAAVFHTRADFAALLAPSLLLALLVLWAHRENLRRLRSGTESKFRWQKDAPKEGER